MTSRSVTLDDVAQLAGVSYQTVSRVLNRSEQVSPRTREKVEAAMQQLNYVPNRVAQQLAGKATRTLGTGHQQSGVNGPSADCLGNTAARRQSRLPFSHCHGQRGRCRSHGE